MIELAKEVDSIEDGELLFSICTLVTDFLEYEVMLKSCFEAGFNSDFCEFLYVDNTSNKYNAYEGINILINKAKGKYLIVCHQDVEFRFDKCQKLIDAISNIEALDKKWGVIGNAGALNLHNQFIKITQGSDFITYGKLPHQVNSLDENLLIFKKSSNISLSHNFNSFHFYGTDICLMAKMLGLSCWAIDFHVLHKSSGKLNSTFEKERISFIKKWQRNLGSKFIRTTCTHLFLSSSKTFNKIMNSSLGLLFTKILYRFIKEKPY